MNNLPKVVTRQHGSRGWNLRPLSHQFDALVTTKFVYIAFADCRSAVANCYKSEVWGTVPEGLAGGNYRYFWRHPNFPKTHDLAELEENPYAKKSPRFVSIQYGRVTNAQT